MLSILLCLFLCINGVIVNSYKVSGLEVTSVSSCVR